MHDGVLAATPGGMLLNMGLRYSTCPSLHWHDCSCDSKSFYKRHRFIAFQMAFHVRKIPLFGASVVMDNLAGLEMG